MFSELGYRSSIGTRKSEITRSVVGVIVVSKWCVLSVYSVIVTAHALSTKPYAEVGLMHCLFLPWMRLSLSVWLLCCVKFYITPEGVMIGLLAQVPITCGGQPYTLGMQTKHP